MSILQTYLFDTESNYTKENTVVEGGVAKLSLIPNPGVLFSNDFSSDTGFTYDNSKAEFVAGMLQAKDQTPLNSILATKFTNKDLNWRKDGGSLTGTILGGASISGGKLVCTGAQGVYYTKNTSVIETHKFKYTPNYTSGPPINVNVFTCWNGTNLNDRFFLSNSPSGNNLRFHMINSGGADVTGLSTVGAWNPTAGQEYEFEIVINATAGTIRVFIDGNLLGTVSPGAWTRGTSASRYYLGAASTVYNRSEGSYDDYIAFSNAQHTASYTPGYTLVDTIYSENKVDGPPFTYSGVGSVLSIDDATFVTAGAPRYIVGLQYWDGVEWTLSDGTYTQANDEATLLANILEFNTGGGGVLPWSVVFPTSNTLASIDSFQVEVTGEKYSTEGYLEPTTPISVSELLSYEHDVTNTVNTDMQVILNIDGQLTYWDGLAWVDSDGSFLQSNTEADVANNLASLVFGVNSSVNIRWVMTSTSNTESPELEASTVVYDFGGVAPSLTTCLVYGYVKDIGNTPIEGVNLKFSLVRELKQYREANNTIIESTVTVVTDANGYFEQNLVKSSQYTVGGKYKVVMTKDTIINTSINDDSTALTFEVPDDNTKDLTELLPSV